MSLVPRRWRSPVMLLMLLFECVPAAGAEDNDAILQAVLADWKQRREAIDRVRYTLNWQKLVPRGAHSEVAYASGKAAAGEPVPAEDRTFKLEIQLWLDFERNRARQELRGRRFDEGFHYDVYLYNGTELQAYRPAERNPESHQSEFSVELYKRTEEGFAGRFFETPIYPLLLAHGVFPRVDTPASPVNLRPELDRALFNLVTIIEQDGRRHALLRTGNLSSRLEAYFELLVDLERNSSIVRWSSYAGGKEDVRADVEYKQVAGHWLPASWSTSSESGGPPVTNTIHVTAVGVNPSFQDVSFHVKPKPGTVVWDEASDRRVVKGAPGEPDIPVGEAIARQRRRGSFVRWLLAGLAAVSAAGTGVALWWRRRLARERLHSDDG